jgi:hypothetical protein
MNYQQLVQPNLSVVGVPEECLAYVRAVFGATFEYPTAISNWQNAQYPHPNEQPPANVSVPVWFSYNGPDGHVAVSTPQGVYSTSAVGDKVFGSVAELVQWMGEGMVYLGWSEDVDKLRVVQPQGDNNMLDEAGIVSDFQGYLGRSPNQNEINGWLGKDYHLLQQTLLANNGVQQNAIANFANVQAQVATLQAQVTALGNPTALGDGVYIVKGA